MTSSKTHLITKEILEKDLCCGCGACAGVCPVGAMSFDSKKPHMPILNESLCTKCNLCYEVCPGRGYPVNKWTSQNSSADSAVKPLHGPVMEYLAGHACTNDIRSAAASGGIATALLLHCLKENLVDEVLVTVIENGVAIPLLTNNPDKVISAAQSKYAPVQMLSVISELKKNPRRIAATFTPCQMAGWTLAAEKIPAISECLKLSIGLFCGQVQSYDALTTIAASLGVNYPDKSEFVGWRCGEYPGTARFKTEDGAFHDKALYEWLDIAVPHFSLNRCFLCPDGSNWLADLTLGDIHRYGEADQTVIAVRTEKANSILLSAKDRGSIDFKNLTEEQKSICVVDSMIGAKLLPASARIKWLLKHNRPAPYFDFDEDMIRADERSAFGKYKVLQYRLIMWARTGWRRSFLLKNPRLMQTFGHFLYYFPNTIPGWNIVHRMARVLMRRK